MSKLIYPVANFASQVASTLKQDTHMWWFKPIKAYQFGDIICVDNNNKCNCHAATELPQDIICLITPNQRYRCYKPVIKQKYLMVK